MQHGDPRPDRRRAASGVAAEVAGRRAEGVCIPAWVAEMDTRWPSRSSRAVAGRRRSGRTGYRAFPLRMVANWGEAPDRGSPYRPVRQWTVVPPNGWCRAPMSTVGVRVALDVLQRHRDSDGSAGSLLMNPQHGLAQITGREQWDLPVDSGRRGTRRWISTLLDRLFARGGAGRSCSPSHTTPVGTSHTRSELEGIRDVALTLTAAGWSATRSTARSCSRAPRTCPTSPSRAPPTRRGRGRLLEGVQHRWSQVRPAHPGRPGHDRATGRADPGAQTTRGRRWGSSPRSRPSAGDPGSTR